MKGIKWFLLFYFLIIIIIIIKQEQIRKTTSLHQHNPLEIASPVMLQHMLSLCHYLRAALIARKRYGGEIWGWMITSWRRKLQAARSKPSSQLPDTSLSWWQAWAGWRQQRRWARKSLLLPLPWEWQSLAKAGSTAEPSTRKCKGICWICLQKSVNRGPVCEP